MSVLQTYGGARFRGLPAAALLVRGELCAALLHHCTSNVTGLVSLSLRVFVALVKDFKVRDRMPKILSNMPEGRKKQEGTSRVAVVEEGGGIWLPVVGGGCRRRPEEVWLLSTGYLVLRTNQGAIYPERGTEGRLGGGRGWRRDGAMLLRVIFLVEWFWFVPCGMTVDAARCRVCAGGTVGSTAGRVC